MALIIEDRVAETSVTTGIGALALAGAIAGFKAFSAVCAVADTCYYSIEGVDANGIPTGEWETGLGTYSAASELTRTTIHRSSNADAAVSFAAGTKRVMISVTRSHLEGLNGVTPADGTFDVTGNLTVSGTVNSARIGLGGTGSHNIYFAGSSGALMAPSGLGNIAIGQLSGDAITTANYNVIVGYNAAGALTTGGNNIAIGFSALKLETTGTNNTVIGNQAGENQNGAANNMLLGAFAGGELTTGGGNTAIGYGALFLETTGSSNVAVGNHAGRSATAGTTQNVYIGQSAAYANATGNSNVAIGQNSLRLATAAAMSVAIGQNAGYDVTTGIYNTFVGRNTGRGITTGSGNTVIGAEVLGLDPALTNNVIIADGTGTKRFHWDGTNIVLNGNVIATNLSGTNTGDQVLEYRYGGFAVSDITASEILMDHVVTTAHTLADDFAGCRASVGTNPAAVWAADIQLNGVSVGSLSISTGGVATFTTTGTTVAVAAGDVVTLVAPAGVDASIARLRWTFEGTI